MLLVHLSARNNLSTGLTLFSGTADLVFHQLLDRVAARDPLLVGLHKALQIIASRAHAERLPV